MPVTNRGREAQRNGGRKGGIIISKRQQFRKPFSKLQFTEKPPTPLKQVKGRCNDCGARFSALGTSALRKLLLAHWEDLHRCSKHVYRLPTLQEALKQEPETEEPVLVPLEPEGGDDDAT